ncbi:MAG: hypothetical protein H0X25_18245 [Acidobacteriales bacterium]|nr:hypothetical protein [Terriglobales bacterium]
METLRELAGCRSKSAIAKRLGRTVCSVKAKATSLQLCTRVRDGYSQQDLTELFGVSAQTIRRWTMRSWLTVTNGRVCDEAVIRFLKNHPDQYSLRRVNEEWFKGLIFPRFNVLPLDRPGGESSRSGQQDELDSERFAVAANERESKCA